MLLGILGGSCLGFLQHEFRKKKILTKISLSILAFAVALLFTLLVDNYNIYSEIYGVDGRRNGVITYLILSLISLCTSFCVTSFGLYFFNKIILLTGLFASLYAILQIANLDPLPWDRNLKWISSTFGNPNFLSSFLAMACVPLVLLFFSGKMIFSSTLLIINFFVMYQTKSYQGFISLFVALNVVLLIYILKLKDKFITKIAFTSISLAFLNCLIFDILQKAPWDSLLYKDSLSTRFDYWRAAIRIFRDHPLFGIGMDQFGNHFGRYRDLNAAINIEGNLSTDSVHNIFLDILVSGGLFLFIPYVIIILLTIRQVVKSISRFEKIDKFYISIVGVWVVFLAQSLISINHLGLAVWGWIAMGFLIIYDPTRENHDLISGNVSKQVGRQVSLAPNRYFPVKLVIGGVIGGLFVMPIWNVNSNLLTAYKNKDQTKLISVGNAWPQDPRRMSKIAETLIEIGSTQEAERMLKRASKIESNSDVPLKIMLNLPNLSTPEKDSIMKRILELDPYFKIANKIK